MIYLTEWLQKAKNHLKAFKKKFKKNIEWDQQHVLSSLQFDFSSASVFPRETVLSPQPSTKEQNMQEP